MRSLIIFSALVIFGSCIPLDRNNFRHFTSDLINENAIENSQQKSRVQHEENKIDSEEPPRNGVLHAEAKDVSEKEEHPDYSDVVTIDQHTPQDHPESTCPYTSSFISVQPKFLPILPLPPKVSHDSHPHLHLTNYKSNLPYYFGLPRLSPLKALPLVHSTYIHGLRPSDEARYDDEIYSENSLQMPNNVRIQRTLVGAPRDDYHDFLAQLEHDAMMPNILPTMAVRYSENLKQYAPRAVTFGDVVALFPQSVSASSIPILISCATQVDSGVLANQLEITEDGSYRSQENNVASE